MDDRPHNPPPGHRFDFPKVVPAAERRLVELTDAERQRLRIEIHDTLGQELTAIDMLVTTLRHQLGDSPHAALLDSLDSSVHTAKNHLRRIVKGLLPVAVDAHGLHTALKELAEETARVQRIDCTFESPQPILLDDNFVATHLFLIAREAVHNTVKHAEATRIIIRLTDQDGLELTVTDNGKGFPADAESSEGIGLQTMQYRCNLVGGTLTVKSQSSGGTLVRCHVPQEIMSRSASVS